MPAGCVVRLAVGVAWGLPEGLIVSRKDREEARARRRVKQMRLPSDDVRPPAGGDWSRWEARAREQLERQARRQGVK